jgi:hypothetical protein
VPEPSRNVTRKFRAADRKCLHQRQHQNDYAKSEDRKKQISRPADSLETSRWSRDQAGSFAAPFIAARITGLVYAGHAASDTIKSRPSIDLVIAEP